MAEGFLARSGLDSIDIGGHKIPIALIGGVAALAGVFLVIRARNQGQSVAAVGSAPATAAAGGFGLPAPGADVGPALADISQQLTTLGQGVNTPSSSTSTPVPAGSQPGEDSGFFFGAAPSAIPAGKQLVWRYTSKFVAANPNLPGVNSNLGLGYGPPPGTPGSQFAYSWEWALI